MKITITKRKIGSGISKAGAIQAAIQMLLIILKLYGWINLSWVVILLPILIPTGMIALIETLIFFGIIKKSNNQNQK